jgi:hypothetical protein
MTSPKPAFEYLIQVALRFSNAPSDILKYNFKYVLQQRGVAGHFSNMIVSALPPRGCQWHFRLAR